MGNQKMVAEACLECCKYGRHICKGKPEKELEFPDNQEHPVCYEDCPFECPYEGECLSLHNYPPEDVPPEEWR